MFLYIKLGTAASGGSGKDKYVDINASGNIEGVCVCVCCVLCVFVCLCMLYCLVVRVGLCVCTV